MEQLQRMTSPLGDFSSGASLGGKVSQYRDKENIYKQGMRAYTLFYIQEGGVCLTSRGEHQPSAVTAILGVGDFFGELCLAGYPFRMSTAVALTASTIRTIQKQQMLRMLRKKNKTSNSLVAYLLASVKNYQDHVAHLLTSSAEQRLAQYCSLKNMDGFCDADILARRTVSWPQRVLAHLAFHAAWIPSFATGHQTFFENFVKNRVMEVFSRLRGE